MSMILSQYILNSFTEMSITRCLSFTVPLAVCVADGLIVSHLPYGPTAYFTLTNVVMRHDIPSVGTMSEMFPHLIFDNFTSKLGKRVKSLVDLTPVSLHQ